jgi:micrococcal nuclease
MDRINPAADSSNESGFLYPSRIFSFPNPTSFGTHNAMTYRLFMLGFFALTALGEPVKIIWISDGDSCSGLTAQKERIEIRLAGIDSPELDQPFGPEAKQALFNKVLGKTVELTAQSEDDYGRTIADLHIGSRWINRELVEEGWAWHYEYYRTDTQLAESESRARSEKRGLWAAETPVAPWTYRWKLNPHK